jgi:hypothetical protein
VKVSAPRLAARCQRRALLLTIGVSLAIGACSLNAFADPSHLPPETGYNYNEIESPRIGALGGALRAFSNSIDALFINPANMVATRVYHIGAFAQIWPEAQRQSYGAAAVDSIVSSTHIAGGFSGTWTSQDPDGIQRTDTDLRFALAFPFSQQFFVGVGGRYMWLKQDGPGPLDPSLASSGIRDQNIVRGMTVDAGATFKPTENIAISVVGNNLNNPGNGFQPTSFGGGLGFGNDELTLEGDVVADFTTWQKTTVRGMGGFEFLAAGHYPLRIGYRYDQGENSHALSGGVGYDDRTFSVEFGLRRILTGTPATALMIGFTYNLEATGLTPAPSESF